MRTFTALVIFLISSLLPAPVSAAVADAPPQGALTSISAVGNEPAVSPGLVKGWAADPNNDPANQRVTVHFYLDAPSGSAAFLGSVITNMSNTTFFNANGYGKFSGFEYQIPVEKIEDGRQHTLYAYAIDITNSGAAGTNKQLSGSPKTIPIVPKPVAPALALNNLMLNNVTGDSVTLVVDTGRNSNITVQYGKTTAYGTSKSSTGKAIHKIILTGLQPDSLYHYKVTAVDTGNTANSISSPDSQFKSKVTSGNPFTFGVVSDMQTQNWSVVASKLNAKAPDLILVPGDNSNNAGLNKIKRLDYYKKRWQSDVFNYSKSLTNHIPAYFIMGNHDEYQENNHTDFVTAGKFFSELMANPNPNGNTDNYYSFDYGDIHFVALNSHYSCITPEQQTWLASDLQATRQIWKILSFHIPNTNPSGVSNCASTNGVQAAAIQKLFEDNGVDMVINGHSHTYHRWVKNGIYYLTNTTAGTDLLWPEYAVPANNPGDPGTLPKAIHGAGYLFASVTPQKITLTSYSDANAVLDTFALTKSAATVIPSDLTDAGDKAGDQVNIFDFNILLTDFGKKGTAGWIRTDIIKNGAVDIFDYNAMIGDWGK